MIFINRKAQAAIWIILAIVLVGSMILFFTIERNSVVTTGQDRGLNPESFIDRCVRENTNRVIDLILPKGGFLEDTNTKLFNNINVSYICYNRGNYGVCINQHPLLLNEIRQEIVKGISPEIESCFRDLRLEAENRNWNVELGDMKIEVNLAPKKVFTEITRKAILTKGDTVQIFEKFESEFNSPIYDLGNVAIEIASQEAKYCYFEYVGYQILHPEFDIRKTAMSDSTKIYTIRDKYSNKEMNIAIRSCAIPAGI